MDTPPMMVVLHPPGQCCDDRASRRRDDAIRYLSPVHHLLAIRAVGVHVVRPADHHRRGCPGWPGEHRAHRNSRRDACRRSPAFVRLVALTADDAAGDEQRARFLSSLPRSVEVAHGPSRRARRRRTLRFNGYTREVVPAIRARLLMRSNCPARYSAYSRAMSAFESPMNGPCDTIRSPWGWPA
jgi:hypothetical protein